MLDPDFGRSNRPNSEATLRVAQGAGKRLNENERQLLWAIRWHVEMNGLDGPEAVRIIIRNHHIFRASVLKGLKIRQ